MQNFQSEFSVLIVYLGFEEVKCKISAQTHKCPFFWNNNSVGLDFIKVYVSWFELQSAWAKFWLRTRIKTHLPEICLLYKHRKTVCNLNSRSFTIRKYQNQLFEKKVEYKFFNWMNSQLGKWDVEKSTNSF